jgi:serine/threonine-protein kinase
LSSTSDPRKHTVTRTLKAGDVLGRFQLLVPIGEGGMGRVWVAREQGFTQRPRLVAIKTALAEDAASEEYWKVLLDEARIASQVQHPNVCAIHALDRERGVVYLVMDWSDGGSLRELLDGMPENRLEPPLAARIVAHVCAGLHAAHELVAEDGAPLGVVHRDVSPQNVLISSNGQVKLTDFGVAKARGQLHAPTQTGEVKGKLSYMAPEQVTTKDVDRRADVFALGCVLYEASCGVRPFHGGDALATLYQLLEQDVVPPSQKKPDYPPGLERIVMKALAREPDARYQTTEDMGRALESWLASGGAMIGDSKIAEVVKTALGERIAARQKTVDTALAAIDRPPTTSATPPPAPGAETLSGAAASTLPLPDPKRRSRRSLFFALGGAAAAGALVFIFLRAQPDEPNAIPSGPILTANSTPAARATVTEAKPDTPVGNSGNGNGNDTNNAVITVRAEPSGASLHLDNGPPLPNPYSISVSADGSSHQLRASADGYASRVEQVTFDRSKEIVLVLSEARGSGNGRRPAVPGAAAARAPARPGAPPPSIAPPPEQPPVEPGRKFGELPTVVKKPPRSLDNDNPFAKQP